jgi:hypothetical protein
MLPPIVDWRYLAGSGAYFNPYAAAAWSMSAVITPAYTSTGLLAGSMPMILVIAAREITRPPG